MSGALRVSALNGARLNFAMALLEGWVLHIGQAGSEDAILVRDGQFSQLRSLDYCGSHAVGAPIMEREGVTLLSPSMAGGSWFALAPRTVAPVCAYRDGQQLVAGMRAIVASRIADGFVIEGRGL